MLTVRFSALVSSLLIAACSDGFEPYSELSSLRVLAVASQPAMPRAGVSSKLSALVYAPPGQDVSYRWSLCPVVAKAKDAYACPITQEAAAGVFGPGLPEFELGSTPEVTLTHGLAPSTLAGLCGRGVAAAGYADSVDCDLGFPVSVVLDVGSGDKSLHAAFVVYLPTSDDASADNHNPTIVDLTADGVPIGDALATPPGAKLGVAAPVAADAVESRPAFPFESGTEPRSERLTFSWFADTGSWNKDRTSFIDGETALADAASNPWTAPDVLPASATFAVVVRDDRGGVGWLRRRPSLGGQP
jgi:hypothetical protein